MNITELIRQLTLVEEQFGPDTRVQVLDFTGPPSNPVVAAKNVVKVLGVGLRGNATATLAAVPVGAYRDDDGTIT